MVEGGLFYLALKKIDFLRQVPYAMSPMAFLPLPPSRMAVCALDQASQDRALPSNSLGDLATPFKRSRPSLASYRSGALPAEHMANTEETRKRMQRLRVVGAIIVDQTEMGKTVVVLGFYHGSRDIANSQPRMEKSKINAS